MRMFKVTRNGERGALVGSTLQEIGSCLGSGEDLDVGDTLTIEVVEMTQEEVDALSEWDGW